MESLITDTSTHPVIGVFPNNWEFSRFGREFERSNERNGDSPIGPMLSVSEYRGIEVRTNFRDGQLPSEDVSHYRVVRPGQLVANLMWLDHGGLGVSNFAGYVSPAYMVFNISERVAPAFAHHVLRSSVYVDSYKRLGRGVRPNSQMVDSVDLRQLPFPLPPFETQQRIADYLDRETAETDAAVADLDRYVELLEKRRQVMIAQSVRGIGSNRSRVHPCTLPGGEGIVESLITDTSTHPVIGVFPNNWEFSRFGREFERSNERNGDSPIGPMLSVSEYRGIEVRTNFRDGQLPSEDVSHYRVVRPGQLVANLMWLDHGGLGVSNFAGYVSPAYMVFNISERVAPAFAHHVLRSSVYVDSYKRLGRGVRPNSQMVDSVDLRQLPFPLPPFETQQRIADYLDRETAEIDSLIADATRLRDLLLKRRSVLITEVVTGRKQV